MEKISNFVQESIQLLKENKAGWLTGLLIYGAATIYSDYKSDVILVYHKNNKNYKAIENCPTIKNKKFYATKYLPFTLS
jgi:hypothetical protein